MERAKLRSCRFSPSLFKFSLASICFILTSTKLRKKAGAFASKKFMRTPPYLKRINGWDDKDHQEHEEEQQAEQQEEERKTKKRQRKSNDNKN